MFENDHVTFLQGLYHVILTEDCAKRYPADREGFSRDVSRLLSCSKTRGLHFFTVDLPAFGKAFDRALSEGTFYRTNLPGMGGRMRGRSLPRLFSGLTSKVFGTNDQLLPIPDTQAIFLIRTLCYSAKKWKVTCADSKTFKTVDEFFRVDTTLRFPTLSWGDPDFDGDRAYNLSLVDRPDQSDRDSPSPRVPGTVVPDIGGRPDPRFWELSDKTGDWSLKSGLLTTIHLVQRLFDLWAGEIRPFVPEEWAGNHGPGAVSDSKTGSSSKYEFPFWPEKLERVFPMATCGFHSHAAWADFAANSPHEGFVPSECPSKLVAVPKTQKAPRLIAAEPTANQWCQQSIKDYLMGSVQRSFLRHSITFRDQTPNRDLALASSATGDRSTVDLSSASDRLSCWLAERAFRRVPSLLDALNATRTGWVANPIDKKSPRYYKMRKLSTMGSATTFPVQSIVFAIIAIAAVWARLAEAWSLDGPEYFPNNLDESAKSLAQKDLEEFRLARRGGEPLSSLAGRLARKVRVFGDDIIIPGYAQDTLKLALEYLDFEVNDAKTFGIGKFRESCGVDAYDGQDVTPPYVLCKPVRSRPESIVSSLATARNFHLRKLHAAGYWLTARVGEAAPKLELPLVALDSGVFGWPEPTGTDLFHLQKRWDEKAQMARYRVHLLTTRRVTVKPMDDSRLLQYFTEKPQPTHVWEGGFNASTRVYIKRAWVLENDLLGQKPKESLPILK